MHIEKVVEIYQKINQNSPRLSYVFWAKGTSESINAEIKENGKNMMAVRWRMRWCWWPPWDDSEIEIEILLFFLFSSLQTSSIRSESDRYKEGKCQKFLQMVLAKTTMGEEACNDNFGLE